MPTLRSDVRILPNERAARAIGDSPKALRQRLDEGLAHFRAAALDPAVRAALRDIRYDLPNQRIVTRCGRVALAWRLREFPDQPPSYRNQQSSVGTVFFVRLAAPPCAAA